MLYYINQNRSIFVAMKGGKRLNAGRKKSDETKPIAFRVPMLKIKEVRELVYNYLNKKV